MAETTLPKLVNANDLAEMFGVCKATIFRWAKAGRIPAPVKLGKGFYWRAEAVFELFNDAESA